CILDMTIAHPSLGCQLMQAYAQKRPQLAKYLDLTIGQEALGRRRAEIDMADKILAGSSFVRDSLLEQGVSPAKISVNPYGVDLAAFGAPPAAAARERVRFLFVGWFSARKGLYDLLDAWRSSGRAKANAE